MNKNKKLFSIYFLLTLALIGFDQLTKFISVDNLKNKDSFIIFKDVFEFSYVENKGIAWGAFSGKLSIFIVFTIIITPIILFAIYRINTMIEYFNKRINIKAFRFLQIVLVVLLSGAIGNLIDRIVHGYVIDFIYFKLIDFPVFNVADCYITISTIALIIICMFCLNNDEVDYLMSSKKKWQVNDEN